MYCLWQSRAALIKVNFNSTEHNLSAVVKNRSNFMHDLRGVAGTTGEKSQVWYNAKCIKMRNIFNMT
jgi:hypothetical protein